MNCKKIIEKLKNHIGNTESGGLYKIGFLYKLHEKEIFDKDLYYDLKKILLLLNKDNECLKKIFNSKDSCWMCNNYVYHVYNLSNYLLWILINELQFPNIIKKSGIDYHDLETCIGDLLDLFKNQLCIIKPS